MREARAVMADLAATGLSPEQLTLLMELSASLAAEARPMRDESAERRRAKDREYQAEKRARRQNRQISADKPDPPPNDIYSNPPPEPVEPSGSTSPCRFSVEDAVEAWNEVAGRLNLRKAKTLDARRRKLIQTRLRDGGEERWREALAAVERSKFCRGENDRGWKADLDFLCQPKSFAKLIDGSYGEDAGEGGGKVVQLDPEARAAEFEQRAADMRKINQHDRADDWERRARKLRTASIGSLVENAAQSVRMKG